MTDLAGRVLIRIFGRLFGDFNSAFSLDESATEEDFAEVENVPSGLEYSDRKTPPISERIAEYFRETRRKISDAVGYYTGV